MEPILSNVLDDNLEKDPDMLMKPSVEINLTITNPDEKSQIPDFIVTNSVPLKTVMQEADQNPDKLMKLSVKFIRDNVTPNPDENVQWIKDTFQIQNEVFMRYICDVCDATYDTLDMMNTDKCKHCGKCFDYCKTHETINKCPFCNEIINMK